jgi:hypothetical protein
MAETDYSIFIHYLEEIEKRQRTHLKQFSTVVTATKELQDQVVVLNGYIKDLKQKNYQLVYWGVSYVLIMQLLLVGVQHLF